MNQDLRSWLYKKKTLKQRKKEEQSYKYTPSQEVIPEDIKPQEIEVWMQ